MHVWRNTSFCTWHIGWNAVEVLYVFQFLHHGSDVASSAATDAPRLGLRCRRRPTTSTILASGVTPIPSPWHLPPARYFFFAVLAVVSVHHRSQKSTLLLMSKLPWCCEAKYLTGKCLMPWCLTLNAFYTQEQDFTIEWEQPACLECTELIWSQITTYFWTEYAPAIGVRCMFVYS